MKLFQAYYLLLFIFLSLKVTSIIATPKYAKHGCKDMCGNVRIPYPFGIGARCSINRWYSIDCNSSTPYLSELNHLQVLDVKLEIQTVIVNMPTTAISDCQNEVGNSSQTMRVGLGRSPFLFSKPHNIFVFQGCGNAFMMDDNGSVLTGCSTNCRNDTLNDRNKCFGISCCQTSIPSYLKSYSINLTNLDGDSACGFASLMDENAYVEGKFPSQSVSDDSSKVPVSLLWTLTDRDHATDTCYSLRQRLRVDLNDGTTMESWKCYISPFVLGEGNPYLPYGYAVSEECARCRDIGGSYCDYNYDDNTFTIDGFLANKSNITCRRYGDNYKSKPSLGVILGTHTG